LLPRRISVIGGPSVSDSDISAAPALTIIASGTQAITLDKATKAPFHALHAQRVRANNLHLNSFNFNSSVLMPIQLTMEVSTQNNEQMG
jgi:hypothetical protein